MEIQNSENYKAVVVEIKNIIPLEGCDNIVGTTIFGNHVIVDKNTKVGDIGIFFPVETQLSEDYCYENNLYSNKELNKNKEERGFFGDNRRVRAVKLRKYPSMGLFMPLLSLNYILHNRVASLELGTEFNELAGIPVCCKYVPKGRTQKAPGKGTYKKKRSDRVSTRFFPEHFKTTHLAKALSSIPENKVHSITWKLHGTSLRVGYIPVKRKLMWQEKLAKLFWVDVRETEYAMIYGSRKVIKNQKENNHYYSEDIWSTAGAKFAGLLKPGEMVYAEIVGFTSDGAHIQKGFTYGCQPGEHKIYVYRMTLVNEEGVTVDYSWEQVKQRCLEMGMLHVPEVEGSVYDCVAFNGMIHFDSEEGTLARIQEELLEKNSVLDPSHVEEGVCVRVEGITPSIYKVKSFRFLEEETKQLDNNILDLETEQENEELQIQEL